MKREEDKVPNRNTLLSACALLKIRKFVNSTRIPIGSITFEGSD